MINDNDPEAGHPLHEALSGSTSAKAQRLTDKYVKRGRKVTKPSRTRIPTEFTESLEDEIIRQDTEDKGLVPMHNSRNPEHRIMSEKPEHRLICLLYAQGYSTKEIFQHFGGSWDDELGRPLPVKQYGGRYSYAWLTQIRRQPWFEQKLLTYLEEQGRDRISAQLEAEFEPSLQVVKELRDDDTAPAPVRLNAANSLIDRFLGKPTQHIRTEGTKEIHHYEHEVDEVDRELKRIESQLKSVNPALVIDAEEVYEEREERKERSA